MPNTNFDRSIPFSRSSTTERSHDQIPYKLLLGGALLILCASQPISAGSGIVYTDIAGQEASTLNDYNRSASATAEIWAAIREAGVFTFLNFEDPPNKWRGSPGVVILDFDNDGDSDIYVTNGPGTANSLYSNQLVESGRFFFLDVAHQAGVAAIDQDSSGACAGDVDNDGDRDLFVLDPFDVNRMFENNGDGTFTDITATSGLGNDLRTSVGCSFGDVNGDGLLDVAIANNTLDWSNLKGIGPVDAHLHVNHNQLYLNTGNNAFTEVSDSSGIEELAAFPPGAPGKLGPTWAIAIVDYDLDGDGDILHADDGGAGRGFIHVLQNDGAGHFTDVTVESGMQKPGHWMGLSFGDLNGDGHMDVFGTNIGDWPSTVFSHQDPVYGNVFPYELGQDSSRWFLGAEGGVFTDPGVGELVATPFGWGTSMVDYDNDGDTDIIYHGGLAFPPTVTHDNPGSILTNDGTGLFTYDLEALSASTDHRRRTVHGMAIGDLDDNGFADIVSVSNFDSQESIPLVTYNVQWGSALDGIAVYEQIFVPTDTFGVWAFSGHEDHINGSLSVEISSGNSNNWIKVRLLGTTGLTSKGKVNRDGIGAVVRFTSHRGASTLRPVLGGASYASQDSLELSFGLGSARKGDIDVLWPGGVRNRLENVRHGERVLLPEIPCSYDADWESFTDYHTCVRAALDELVSADVLDARQRSRLLSSALRAYF